MWREAGIGAVWLTANRNVRGWRRGWLSCRRRDGLFREHGASFTLLNTHTHPHSYIPWKAVLKLKEKRGAAERTAPSLSGDSQKK
ncbi:hypothetical protein AMECASPLE_001670 [Ameca splendens]|uniref:Uncharacterized protein n=1 Tax=Ameca splendens TaxID=208324 RepID=A0ABV0XAW5_9TELE